MEIELTNERVVAIDGGTATGKGRLIEELSRLLRSKGVSVIHVSTGHIYRAVALACVEKASAKVAGKRDKTPFEIAAEALKLVREWTPEQILACAQARDIAMHGGVVWMDNSPTTEEMLKGPSMGMGSSFVSEPRIVRDYANVVARLQANEFDGFVLMDGRDTTHTILPDAKLKILLTVAPTVAAQRSLENTIEEIIARDLNDRSKPYGMLKHPDDPGDGVIVMPTDAHSPESARDHVYELMKKIFPGLPA